MGSMNMRRNISGLGRVFIKLSLYTVEYFGYGFFSMPVIGKVVCHVYKGYVYRC